MLDFFKVVKEVETKKGQTTTIVRPEFKVRSSKDLMIRGGDFYAVYDEDTGFWSTDEDTVLDIIDREVMKVVEEHQKTHMDHKIVPKLSIDSSSGVIDRWHKYLQSQMRDHYHDLDRNIIFADSDVKKEDYASRALSYKMAKGDISAYDELVGTLYAPEERKKFEWAIGAIIKGDSKWIQKFLVFYGGPGTGKSTVLKIIEWLFEDYTKTFEASALGNRNAQFSLESLKDNPLVAIQHDGDLSRVEDNTRINSIVSHEKMVVNEKHKSIYEMTFDSFLIIGTNKMVRITDSKSGVLRRLIDIEPTGNKVSQTRYKVLMQNIRFELGAIAYHCLKVYEKDPGAYDDYFPKRMVSGTNDIYDFVEENQFRWKELDFVTLTEAYAAWKQFVIDNNIPYTMKRTTFKEELKSYFKDFKDEMRVDGSHATNVYIDLKREMFNRYDKEESDESDKTEDNEAGWLSFDKIGSLFDVTAADWPAQYARDKEETPLRKWENVTTKLSDITTTRLHYVKVPLNHIVIDFDIKDEDGNKSFEKNLEAALKWPPTYAELSKSGAGIHLHYIYDGDPTKLSRIHSKDVEIKVFTGDSSLRRKLTKCNDIPIATISSGLPMKGETKMVNWDGIKSEKQLRTMIEKNLRKEYHSATKPSVDYIYSLLEEAYESGLHYDVTNLRPAVLTFAMSSSHQADYCIKLVNKMHFQSEDISEANNNYKDDTLIFYDIEVFPNLFLVNWKIDGAKKCVRMINPSPSEIEELCRHKLVGFNCRRYDNHLMYARMMGYDNEQLYNLSKKIVEGNSRNCFFGEAYNLSFTDVYDFASAGNKKSLKKLEIEMGIHHQELGLPWDQPVPKHLWAKVAEYCDNDVIATEAAFHYLESDWLARQILADIAQMSENDTTNSLTTKIIFGKERHPQGEFNYRNLAEPVTDLTKDQYDFLSDIFPDMMSHTHGERGSLLPYFEGYKFENGVSTYKGVEVGEGGYVYAEPGIYKNVALIDVTSMHPHSIIAECLFGSRFTRRFYELVYGRVDIKHEDWVAINNILDGKLTKYVDWVKSGKIKSKDLANALKTAINSVYGLTAAKFDNPFRDARNVDNIVAKRGALFMVDLKEAVEAKGFTVAHIKTDSIKIPNATPEIIDFVMNFGREYGYFFEHEATYERMCLVNDAVYIARYAKVEDCQKMYGYVPDDNAKYGDTHRWTATGAQFAVPYVFKKLFSHEEIEFKDLCETKSVSAGEMYVDMNENLPDVTLLEKEYKKLAKKFETEPSRELEESLENLSIQIEKGHDYQFVGRVGLFCPIKPGKGGGVLYRFKDDKYYSVTGTSGFRWLEAEDVEKLNKQDDIDETYYIQLVDKAVETIAQYGDAEWFIGEGYQYDIITDIPASNAEQLEYTEYMDMLEKGAA